MGIDPRTIFFTLTLILSVMGLAQLTFYRLRPREHYFAYWALANFAGMGAVLLLSFHGKIIPLLSIATANALIVLAWACCWNGCRVFAGRRPQLFPMLILVTIVFALLAVPSPISTRLSSRILVLSAALEFLVPATGWILLDIARREKLFCAWITTVLAAGVALIIAVRGCWAAWALRPEALLTQGLLGVLLAPSIVVVLAWNMGLTLMVAERMRNGLLHAATRDELTEVLNRRGFKAALWRILQHKDSAHPGALILIDLDYLKVINDTQGHAAGDQMLRCLAEAVNAQLRSDDAVGRLGGDEFAVALSDVDYAQAAEIAERLKAAYTESAALISPDFPPTVSMGIAVIGSDDHSINTLMAKADKALYAAKAANRRSDLGALKSQSAKHAINGVNFGIGTGPATECVPPTVPTVSKAATTGGLYSTRPLAGHL